jgi:hypothetical protein
VRRVSKLRTARLHSHEALTEYIRLTGTAMDDMYNSTKGTLFLLMVPHAGHNLTTNLMRMAQRSRVIIPLSYVGCHRCSDDESAHAGAFHDQI